MKVWMVALAGLALSCASESNPNPVGSGGTGGSGASGGAGGSGGAGAGVGDINGGVGVCDGTTRPAGDAFCHPEACAQEPDCARAAQRKVDSCCVLVGEPGKNASDPFIKRTTDTKEYSDPAGGPPNLSCFEPAGYPAQPPAGTPPTVTLTGVVEAFANGCDLVNVKVEVFTVKRTGDPATDGDIDQLVGTAIVTDDTFPIVLEDVDTCGEGPDGRKNRSYEYPNVPMYTELIIKSTGATAGAGWAPLYTYNVYVDPSDPDYDSATNTFHRNVHALAADDFATIPTVAIARTISAGNGAIGGEVHDCDNIRIQNARVDVTSQRVALVYFNSDEDDPLPDINRDELGTGRTALYSALDVRPGWARVAATGMIEDGGQSKLVSLGFYDVRVYADSVTSVTLRGLRPYQLP